MRSRRRCRLHGGKSTGPRTPEGAERARLANLRHGRCTEAAQAERAAARAADQEVRRIMREMDDVIGGLAGHI
jgi:hypothetical protein